MMHHDTEGAWRPEDAPQGPYGPPGGSAGSWTPGHPPQNAPPPAGPTQDERNWALFAHLAAFAGVFFPIIGNLLGPFLVWILKKDTSRFVDHHGKESLNFQIFISIILVALSFLFSMGVFLAILLVGIPILVLAAVALAVVFVTALILVIVAAVAASKGTWYRYPFSFRFIH